MRFYAVNGEAEARRALAEALCAAAPEAEVRGFARGEEALEALRAGDMPDAVFSEVALPGLSGLALADVLRQTRRELPLVFVTDSDRWALEAYRRHVRGYVPAPASPERLREELEVLGLVPAAMERPRLQVQCFGYFDVFFGGEPVIFRRRKTKELLAYLIDRGGAACDAGEIVTALWEGEGDMQHRKSYLRALTTDLRRSLRPLGLEDVLIRLHNQWAVRTERLDCDYYRMRAGDPEAAGSYRGEYMKQYSWAEMTASQLQFSAR